VRFVGQGELSEDDGYLGGIWASNSAPEGEWFEEVAIVCEEFLGQIGYGKC